MSAFPGVKLVVMADRLFDIFESGDELVWLQGYLGSESVEDGSLLRKSMLWRDWTQYALCPDVDQQKLREEWSKHRPSDEMLTIIRKSTTTAYLKNRLLEISGSEANFRKLEALDWEFVTGEKKCTEDLSLSQQVAFWSWS